MATSEDRRIFLFLTEIDRQCGFIRCAMDTFAQAVESETPDRNILWLSVQSMLISSANISKMLYSHKKAQGRELRKMLGVAEDGFWADRTVRNHFEHFDERMEKWSARDVEFWIDSNIAPSYGIGGAPSGAFLRNLNPHTYEVYVLDDVFDLKQAHEAARMLGEKAGVLLQKLSPPVTVVSNLIMRWEPNPADWGLPSLREKDVARERVTGFVMRKSRLANK